MRRIFGITALVLGGSWLAGAALAQDQLIVPPPALPVIAKSSTPTPPPAPLPSSLEPMALPPTSPVKPTPAPATQTLPPVVETTTLTPGVQVEYTISVRNQGMTALDGVTVEDELPRNAKLLNTDPPAAERHGMIIKWNVGRMDRGDERRFKVIIEPRERGDLRTSTTTASYTLSSTLQPTAPTVEARLEVAGPETVTAGTSAQYEIQLTNSGAAPLMNVVIKEELGEGMDHEKGRGIEAKIDGPIGPGETRVLPLHLRATTRGLCRNHIVVRANNVTIKERWQEVKIEGPVVPTSHTELPPPPPPPPSMPKPIAQSIPIAHSSDKVLDECPKSHEEPAVEPRPMSVPSVPAIPAAVVAPPLRLDMAVADDGPEVGADMVYAVHLINQGDTPALNAKLCAILPEGMSFVSAEAPTRLFDDGREIRFASLPELPAKSEITYRIRVRGVKAGEWPFRAYLSCEKSERQTCLERNVRVIEPRTPADH